jgi:hypothetical protein
MFQKNVWGEITQVRGYSKSSWKKHRGDFVRSNMIEKNKPCCFQVPAINAHAHAGEPVLSRDNERCEMVLLPE